MTNEQLAGLLLGWFDTLHLADEQLGTYIDECDISDTIPVQDASFNIERVVSNMRNLYFCLTDHHMIDLDARFIENELAKIAPPEEAA